MKALPFVIPKPKGSTLVYQEDNALRFYDKLHQHEDIQLSYIKEGYGTLVVGDAIQQYETNDFIVIGSNLPHVFKSDTDSGKRSNMRSLFFTKSSFGADFFKLTEFEGIDAFFKNSMYGLKINTKNTKIPSLFSKLVEASTLERFIILLQILEVILKSEQQTLSNIFYTKSYSTHEGERMRKIFEHTLNAYKHNITLDEISEIASMTKHAFCKYFKKRTNKTYIQFVNELRVQHACKMLLKHSEVSIAEIADVSGFGTISNFNKQFQKLKRQSPSEYRASNQFIS